MGAALRREAWPARLAAFLLIAVIFASSLIMVALPLGWLWFLSGLDLGYTEIYFLALIGCPTAIVAWGWVLLRLNRAYADLTDRDGRPVLEASITLAVLIAVAALIFWVVILGADGGPNQGPWPA